jgi:branched-chain amino acid transport system substrate-binding protein
LLAAAIERSGDASPEGVAEGLAGLEGYEGVTGTISFVGGSRIPTKSVALLQIVDGRHTLVVEVIPERVPGP